MTEVRSRGAVGRDVHPLRPPRWMGRSTRRGGAPTGGGERAWAEDEEDDEWLGGRGEEGEDRGRGDDDEGAMDVEREKGGDREIVLHEDEGSGGLARQPLVSKTYAYLGRLVFRRADLGSTPHRPRIDSRSTPDRP